MKDDSPKWINAVRAALVRLSLVFALTISASAAVINIPDDYSTIQQGIDASSDGDTVLVQPGTYVENINFDGHNIVLGSLFLTTGDFTFIEQTVIDGDSAGSVVSIMNGIDERTRIVGFTIQNGYSHFGGGIFCRNSNPVIEFNTLTNNTAFGDELGGNGGGIFCSTADPVIKDNFLISNSAVASVTSVGGAIGCEQSEPEIRDNIIGGNSADFGGGIYLTNSHPDLYSNIIISNNAENGGGIHCENSSARFYNCLITMNIAEHGGGGIDNYGSTPGFYACQITANTAGDYGGGISNDLSSATFAGCLIAGNNTSGAGGGVSNYTHSQAVFVNCTFSMNSAQDGGAVWNGGSTPSIANCVLWGDTPDEHSGSESIIIYTNIEGGWEGEGNIDSDPLFRDPDSGDFHLMSASCGDPYDSPCIDAGDPALIDSLLDCAWGLGELRSDMGAYGGGDSAMVAIDDIIQRLPSQLAFLQNYPNPFNSSTTITYSLPKQSVVQIEIYSVLGQRVATLLEGFQEAGYHTFTWQADDHPSGIYFARLRVNRRSENIKMVLLK